MLGDTAITKSHKFQYLFDYSKMGFHFRLKFVYLDNQNDDFPTVTSIEKRRTKFKSALMQRSTDQSDITFWNIWFNLLIASIYKF